MSGYPGYQGNQIGQDVEMGQVPGPDPRYGQPPPPGAFSAQQGYAATAAYYGQQQQQGGYSGGKPSKPQQPPQYAQGYAGYGGQQATGGYTPAQVQQPPPPPPGPSQYIQVKEMSNPRSLALSLFLSALHERLNQNRFSSRDAGHERFDSPRLH